eukprot:TRINITY_DN8993_c2_g2_i4.p1 TRINITY_DN8993_c2_g2~~TRINITY_DN8993_c2_g2_i4.p1  ORF type:complete len:397 (+),score=80.11 TRINITY_DN8993_c2_g2_i4:84-1193(+)
MDWSSSAALTSVDSQLQAQIDFRSEVADKYSEVLDHLSLIGNVGNPQFEDLPMEALERLKELDSDFPIDIDRQLGQLEQRVSKRRLEHRWKEQYGYIQDSELDDQMRSRMGDWVESRLDTKNPAIKFRLRKIVKPNARPEPKAKLIKQGPHPGQLVTSSRPGYVKTPRRTVQATSHLACLFSKEDSAERPEFLAASERNSRRKDIERNRAQHLSKMKGRPGAPPSRPAEPAPRRPASPRRFDGTAPRYMDVKCQEAKRFTIEKEVGEQLGMQFDTEHLCLVDVRQGPCEGLVSCRGMRITHISAEEPGEADKIVNAAAMRRALATAAGLSVVHLRLEPCSQKQKIEKRKSEFRQKMQGSASGGRKKSSR